MAVLRPECSWCVPLLLGLWLPACASDDSPEEGAPTGWRIGAKVVDVTPTADEIATGQLYMGAYGILTQRGPATGVHDPVFARSLVLRAGSTSIAMTILDMPGVSNRVLHEVADAVQAATNLSKENIYVGATHSHSAPDLQGLWGSVPDAYRSRLIELTAQSITDAFNSAEPAELFVSKGTGPNRNRRDWPITDPELTVLDAKTRDGQRIATLINFAAHPVKLGAENKLISRDFCGYTVDQAEAELGGQVLFFNGVVGDASPDGGVGNSFDGAASYGGILKDAAIAAMAEQTMVTPGIYRDQARWAQEVTNGGFVALNDAGVLDYDTTTVGTTMGIDTQFTYFRLGTEVQAIAFPGEALTRTGLEVKSKLSSPFHVWLGLTTDTLGYFVKSDEWMTGRNGDYEESVSMAQTAGDNAISVLSDAIARDSTR